VISPILSNLFLHYAFDLWMSRTHPGLPWRRYADDGLAHCRSEPEAEALRDELQARLDVCGLQMHPTKTKIVYCKDKRRRGDYPNVTFDFLGYQFRPRRVANSQQDGFFCGYTPAVSPTALKSIRATIRSLNIPRRAPGTLAEIAEQINPLLRGWIGSYGRFSPSARAALADDVNQKLKAWVMCKHSAFGSTKLAPIFSCESWLRKLARENADLFVHWQTFGTNAFARWERCESRGSRTVLQEAGGEIPPAYSPQHLDEHGASLRLGVAKRALPGLYSVRTLEDQDAHRRAALRPRRRADDDRRRARWGGVPGRRSWPMSNRSWRRRFPRETSW
jgi:RNA-directed DNA polymerase